MNPAQGFEFMEHSILTCKSTCIVNPAQSFVAAVDIFFESVSPSHSYFFEFCIKKMPLFAYTKHGLVVNASACTAEDEFFCCQCKLPLCFVRGSERGAAHFRHVHRNEKCSDSWSQAEEERVRDLDPTVVNRAMTSWHASWQSLHNTNHTPRPTALEMTGAGRAT